MTEISLLIAIVGLVFIGMEVYVRRGFQGKLKDLTDHFIGTKQDIYSVDVTDLEINNAITNMNFNAERKDTAFQGGGKTLITQQNQIVNSTSWSGDTN